jgi:hypothetical protein
VDGRHGGDAPRPKPDTAKDAAHAGEPEGPGPLDESTDVGERGDSPREHGDSPRERGHPEDSAYDPLAAPRVDLAVVVETAKLITRVLTVLLEELGPSQEPGGQAQTAAELRAVAEQVPSMAEELLRRGTGQDPGLGLASTATVGAAKSEAGAAHTKFRKKVYETVRDAFAKILHRLWSMIGHLVTVKEWTVQGQAGDMFGLVSASVSVTFGP